MSAEIIKITHIIPSPKLGGVQTNLLLKSNYDKNYNISRKVIYTVSCTGELLDSGNKLFERYIYCPIMPEDMGHRPYRLFKLFRKWLSIFFVFRLFIILKRDDAKIVHSEDSLKLVSQFVAAFFAGKKFIWQLHTSQTILSKFIIKHLFYFFIKKGIITMIADSKAALQANFSNMDEIINKVYFIQPGIEPAKFSKTQYNKIDIRRKFGFSEKDLIIGSTGRLHWAKGYNLLLESIKMITINKKIKCKLVIAGDGPLKSKLMQQIKALDLTTHVTLLGSIHDIVEFLTMLDFYVQPSLSEGFPISVIEAMAARIPLLCSNAGGLPELIEDGEMGIIIDKNDVYALTQGLIKLIYTKNNIMMKMVEKGYQRAYQYSTESVVKKDLSVYRTLLKQAVL